jgi:hypothetical protein
MILCGNAWKKSRTYTLWNNADNLYSISNTYVDVAARQSMSQRKFFTTNTLDLASHELLHHTKKLKASPYQLFPSKSGFLRAREDAVVRAWRLVGNSWLKG